MENGVYLVTGGSTGLGHEIVRQLVGQGHWVVLTATTDARAQTAAEGFTSEKVVGIALELAEPDCGKRFATELPARMPEGSVLAGIIFNAGIQIVSGRQRNSEGYERTMAVNHLGHLRLMDALLHAPDIDLAPRPRWIFVGSGTHNRKNPAARMFGFKGSQYQSLASWLEGAPLRGNAEKQGLDDYANSKLANIMAAFALGRRFPDWVVTCFDPGLMPGTNLARERPPVMQFLWRHLMPRLAPLLPDTSTPRKSAVTAVRLLLGAEGPAAVGKYINHGGKEGDLAPHAADVSAQDRMLMECERLLGLSFG